MTSRDLKTLKLRFNSSCLLTSGRYRIFCKPVSAEIYMQMLCVSNNLMFLSPLMLTSAWVIALFSGSWSYLMHLTVAYGQQEGNKSSNPTHLKSESCFVTAREKNCFQVSC